MKHPNLQKALHPAVDKHSDDRRDLISIFNGDFVAKQLKFATMHKEAILGGHYHHYKEGFTVLGGNAIFRLYDTNNPDAGVVTHVLTPGNVLQIPAEVAHDALVDAGTTLIGFTEESYVSAEKNDVRFSIDEVISKTGAKLVKLTTEPTLPINRKTATA